MKLGRPLRTPTLRLLMQTKIQMKMKNSSYFFKNMKKIARQMHIRCKLGSSTRWIYWSFEILSYRSPKFKIITFLEKSCKIIYLTRALMRSGELRVLMRGWPKGPPSVSSKVRVVE